MESTVSPLTRTAPTADLRPLVERAGPFLSVVVDTEPAVENAAQRSEQRWRAQRDEALAAGVPAAALERIGDLLADAHLRGPASFVVADGETGELLLVEHLAAMPSSGPFVRWDPEPSLVPLLADRQARLPHVVVRCDREGADVLAVDADGETGAERVRDDGRQYRKSRDVHWEERRAWDRVEHHIARTAEEIVRAAADACRRVGTTLLVVAGDGRTVDQVVERAVAEGLDARPVEGGRGGDGSEDDVDEAADVVVRTVAAEHTVEALRRFGEQLGAGLAAEGFEDVRAALGAGRADTVLVHDGDDRRIDDLVRRALTTSAGVVVVPAHGGPAEGVGALLRWR